MKLLYHIKDGVSAMKTSGGVTHQLSASLPVSEVVLLSLKESLKNPQKPLQSF